MPSILRFLTGLKLPELELPWDRKKREAQAAGEKVGHAAEASLGEKAHGDLGKHVNSKPVRKGMFARRKKGQPVLPANVLSGGNVQDGYSLGLECDTFKFGSVFHATRKLDSERVLCKRYSKEELLIVEDMETVASEVAAMRCLSGQPNIVQLLDVYEDSKYIHLIVERCTGAKLLDSIGSKRDYSEQQVSNAFRSLMSIISTCHSHGVMLRNVKMESFCYSNKKVDAVLKLVDFTDSVIFQPGQKFKNVIGSPLYIAPEVLLCSYGPEADVWSCGVILYILLCGNPPFPGDRDAEIFERVLKGTLDVRSPPWHNISKEARDLVQKLLTREPPARISAKQTLDHPWLKDGGVNNEKAFDASVLTNLTKFSLASKMKKVACQVMARHLPKSQIAELKSLFEAIDVNRSGNITYTELRAGLRKAGVVLPEYELEELLDAMDSDGSGSLDYQEFLAAMAHVQRSYNPTDLARAFHHFDTDRDGFITVRELRRALEENYDLEPLEIETLIQMADTDKNGQIDFEEFVAAMSSE